MMIKKVNSPIRRAYLFSAVRLEQEGKSLRLPGGSARLLFIYLILHPDVAHTREKLAEIVWPDAPPDNIRRKLSDTLYRLRQALGEGWLIVEAETIRINRNIDLWADVWEFEMSLEKATTDALQEAITLYNGDLAPDIYSDWIMPRRVYLREEYHAVLLQLGREAARQSRFEEARQFFSQLSLDDPFREDAHRGLMRSLAALGRLKEAIDGYERFEKQLATDLGVRPTAETRELAEQLRREREAGKRVAAEAKTAPFVGRDAERAQLLTRLNQAHAGKGGVAILLGEAGMGKTRLLEVIQESATWRGWRVAYARGDEFSLPAPYEPFPELLRSLLPPPRVQQMAQLVTRYWLTHVARILPGVFPDLEPGEDIDPRLAPHQIAQAIAQLLGGLTEIAPHLLVIDDVQWSDPSFWTLLTALQPALANLPLLILVSGRRVELQSQAQPLSAIQSWEATGAPVISLSPLDEEEIGLLASAMGQEPLAGTDLKKLRDGSGGNPLLLLTLLGEHDLPSGEDRVELTTLMQRRLDHVSAPAQLALQAAAVLGFHFDYEIWSQATPALPATEMPSVAGELERHRLIELSGAGYRFVHDTLRAHVYAGAPDTRRKQLHAGVLELLQKRGADDNQTLLRHARNAGNRQETAHYALRAGEAAIHAFAFDAAQENFSLALEALPDNAWPDRYRATLGRLRACDSLGQRERQAEDSAALLELARRMDNPRQLAEATYRRADYLWKVGEQAASLELARKGLKLVGDTGKSAVAAGLLTLMARIARNQGDFATAHNLLQGVQKQYRELGDRFGEGQTMDKLANLLHESGEYDRAAAEHERATQLLHDEGYRRHEAHALSGLALSVRAMGDYDRARRLHRQVAAISEELGDLESQWVELVSLGNIAYELGDFPEALTWYGDALPIIRTLNDPFALALALYNMGEAHRDQGALDQARIRYEEVLALCRQREFQRGQGNVHYSLGLTALAEGDLQEAEEALEKAQAIWQALQQGVKLMETQAALALVRLQAGDQTGAAAGIDAALAELTEAHRATQRWRWIHYVAFRVRQAEGKNKEARSHLQLAGQAVAALAAGMPAAAQARFKEAVPVNRDIMAAIGEFSQTVEVKLARAAVPLGRELVAADYTTVSWTLASPLDALVKGRHERRQTVLKRLLAEAQAQGAAPTDADLASALGVSTRTIERDLAALRAEGISFETRRRRL